MDKNRKKRTYYNEDILNKLKAKFGYSLDYIRKSLRGDRTGIMPDTIIKEYKVLEAVSKKAINKASEELNNFLESNEGEQRAIFPKQ